MSQSKLALPTVWQHPGKTEFGKEKAEPATIENNPDTLRYTLDF